MPRWLSRHIDVIDEEDASWECVSSMRACPWHCLVVKLCCSAPSTLDFDRFVTFYRCPYSLPSSLITWRSCSVKLSPLNNDNEYIPSFGRIDLVDGCGYTLGSLRIGFSRRWLFSCLKRFQYSKDGCSIRLHLALEGVRYGKLSGKR